MMFLKSGGNQLPWDQFSWTSGFKNVDFFLFLTYQLLTKEKYLEIYFYVLSALSILYPVAQLSFLSIDLLV